VSAVVPIKSDGAELAKPVELTLPTRWFRPSRQQSREASIEQLRDLGRLFIRSALAVGDLYLRICDHIRAYDLDPDEVTQALRDASFPPSRISEIRRVAFAPENLYREFMSKGLGFRVALEKTRMYYAARRGERRGKRRKLRRASMRVVELVKDLAEGDWEYRAKNHRLVVANEQRITNTASEPRLISSADTAGVATMEVRP